MDGNGRWARRRGLPRVEGHRHGRKVVKQVVKWSVKHGVSHLTLYAFSAENWQRPQREVEALMALFSLVLDEEVEELHEQRVRIRFIGARRRLPPLLRQKMERSEARTRSNRRLNLTIAIDYGGRQEIVRAADAARRTPGNLTERTFRRFLYTGDLPDPDLIIRTAGEMRLSNFLVFQAAYAELHFTRVLWPDFQHRHFVAALKSYARRERRFGKV